LFLLFALPLAVAGCRRDEQIATYDVDHPEREKIRLLAAVLPHGDRTWFVRLSGPETAIADQKKPFDDLIASIQFDDKQDPPIRWKAPDVWEERPGNKMTAVSFRVATQPVLLDATITALGKLGEEGNTLTANVNRWRNQLTLPPVGPVELERLVDRRKIDKDEIFVVDMTGMGVHRKTSKPMHVEVPAAPALVPAGAQLPFRYEVPAGWKQQERPAGISVVSYEVRDDRNRAEITITSLSGKAGGVIGNIVRWREQVGLPATSEAEIRRQIKVLPTAGVEANYVDLASPPGKKDARILGAIVPLEQNTWFIKMTGPTDLVGREKANFEAFVKSLQLDKE
jgi:hypothetical protein